MLATPPAFPPPEKVTLVVPTEPFFVPSASVILVSNYMSRGISNTNNKPAIQGEFRLQTRPGFYVSTWASNVDFNNNGNGTVEIDYFAGFKHKIYELGYDIGAAYYDYPKANGLDYPEYYVLLNYWYLNAGVYYSNNIDNVKASGIYYYGGVNYPIPKKYTFCVNNISVFSVLGYQHLPKEDGDSYTHYSIGLSKGYKQFSFSVEWSDTTGRSHDHLDNGKVIFALSASIP